MDDRAPAMSSLGMSRKFPYERTRYELYISASHSLGVDTPWSSIIVSST